MHLQTESNSQPTCQQPHRLQPCPVPRHRAALPQTSAPCNHTATLDRCGPDQGLKLKHPKPTEPPTEQSLRTAVSGWCAWDTASASLLAPWSRPSSPSCRCRPRHQPPPQTLPHQPPRQATPCTPRQGSRPLPPCRQSSRSPQLPRGCCCCRGRRRSPTRRPRARCGCPGGGSPAGSSQSPPGPAAGAGRGTAAEAGAAITERGQQGSSAGGSCEPYFCCRGSSKRCKQNCGFVFMPYEPSQAPARAAVSVRRPRAQ